MSKTTRYLRGEKVEYTGNTEVLHGRLAYETKIPDGHRKGELQLTYHAPEPTGQAEARQAMARAAAWTAQNPENPEATRPANI